MSPFPPVTVLRSEIKSPEKLAVDVDTSNADVVVNEEVTSRVPDTRAASPLVTVTVPVTVLPAAVTKPPAVTVIPDATERAPDMETGPVGMLAVPSLFT
jgi:hypothetical protein